MVVVSNSIKKPKIGIIGRGFVGKATGLLFAKSHVICYDKQPELCVPRGLTIEQMVKDCEFIFICVPTPMEKDSGRCSLSIINQVKEEIDNAINNIDYTETHNVKPFVFLRSTVPPTTCISLELNFMPEFLTEANWEKDTISARRLYFGINNNLLNTDNQENEKQQIKERIKWLVTMGTCMLHLDNDVMANNTSLTRECIFGTTTGMELFKMFANSFLAMKVGFCNEIFHYSKAFCGDSSVYNEMCDLIKTDNRIGSSHMKVPGPDGKFGFGGTCFPKDINSLFYEMQHYEVAAPITSAVIKRNEQIDRPEKDWETSIGRAVI